MKQAVIAIIFSNDNQSVLAIKRCDVPVWVFPGGGIENGESPEEAVIRETFEETGLIVEVKKIVGEYFPLNKLTNYTLVYECTIKSGVLSKGEETRDIGFFPIKELPLPFLHVHRYWLEDALTFSKTVIKKPIKGTSYFHFIFYVFRHPVLMFRFILSKLNLTINTP